MEINENIELTPIQKFYSNTNILITGATGFLGRILIEKLLRSCSNLATIYVLARDKKCKNLEMRIDELFDDVVFDRLKQEQPKFRHKVVGISGDVSLPNLGLNDQDKQLLINEVSVVFHVAATVRFDEKLKLAIAINVRGPHDILHLAKQMRNLKSIIHVSTAYSNCPRQVIEERFYDPPIGGKDILALSELLPEKTLDNITPILLENYPNTYTFTKQIAEDIVREEGKGLPLAVYRPSIVISTYREPIKGWINNLYGPTGVCAGAGTGVLRVLHSDPEVNANVIPVDMCVNAMIALAWETGIKYAAKTNNNQLTTIINSRNVEEEEDEVPIYHFESSNDKPINWGRFMRLSQHYGLRTPSVKCVWYYSFDLYKYWVSFVVAQLFLHYIPALLVDVGLLCVGKSPKMLKIYKKIHKFTGVISYFCTRNWSFRSERTNRMIDNSMTKEDQELFFCDLRRLDWVEFFTTYLKGIRIHLIQDPIETLEQAKVKWQRFYWLHTAIKAVLGYLLFRFAWFLLTSIYQSFA